MYVLEWITPANTYKVVGDLNSVRAFYVFIAYAKPSGINVRNLLTGEIMDPETGFSSPIPFIL